MSNFQSGSRVFKKYVVKVDPRFEKKLERKVRCVAMITLFSQQ